MNRITQEARKRQAVVKLAKRKGQSYASRIYGVSLSSVKRWCKRYDGTWQSLKERSHRPYSHPKQHTEQEETLIRKGMDEAYFRYGWEGAYILLYKRLSNGRFQWPRSEAELRLLDPQSFRWLMEGLKVEQKTAIRKGKPKDLF